jgi:hypothetical protein
MATRILTPTTLNETGALEFLAELESTSGSVVLDFSQTQFALPLGALLMASSYRTFVANRKVTVTALGIDLERPAHGYLGHMGFFKSLGFPIGKRPGEAAGSSSYIPITVLDLHDLETAHRSRLLETYDEPPIGSLVEVESMKLAKLITQDLRPKINRPIAYCFREVIRNVFEHSGENRCAIYAQRWSDGFIEVAIVDRGKGIRGSLQQKYSLESDRHALATAIDPGISRTEISAGPEWSNSGFGLFVLSELGKELGRFSLCSGNTSAIATSGVLSFDVHNASYVGTAVGLKIRQLSPNKFREFVDDIVTRGEEAIRGRGETVKASKSSRIGSDD